MMQNMPLGLPLLLWHVPFARRQCEIAGLAEAGCYELHAACHLISPHVHPAGRLEICLVDHGQHRDAINGRVYQANKGQGLIVRPGDTHGHHDVAQEPVRVSFLILNVSPARSRFLGFTGAEAQRMQRELLAIEQPCFLFSSRAVAFWQTVMDECRRAGRPDSLDPAAVWNLRCYLPALLAALLESARQSKRSNNCSMAQRVEQLVDRQFFRRVSIGELARACHMSRSCFETRFKRETGLSPIDYLRRHKIEAATTRLADSAEPIARIASELGYSSAQNFAAAFRRFTGRSPSKYRMSFRGRPTANGH